METKSSSETNVVPEKKRNTQTRMWMDGCFDMLHVGHLAAMQQARAMGDSLTIGVQPDTDVWKHKGPPVFAEQERYKLVRAVKWVDEFVEAAPYGTKMEILDKYNCDYCIHGDDVTILTNPQDVLHKLAAVNRFKFCSRGTGPSTTDRIRRVLDRTKYQEESDSQKSQASSGEAGLVGSAQDVFEDESSSFLVTGMKLKLFSSVNSPKPGNRIVYVAGAFDIFHVGHLDFLEKAAAEGDYLIVGVHADAVVRWYKGPIYPMEPLPERALRLLAFRCVSDVVWGSPYTVTKEMMEHLKVDVVCHGITPIKANNDGSDPYEEPKRQGKFKIIDSNNPVTTKTIVERIVNRRGEYEARNKKKDEKERTAKELMKNASLVSMPQISEPAV